MNNNGWCGFWGTLGCLVGLHDWSDRQWRVPRCSRCGAFKHPRNVRQTGNVVMGDMAGGDIVKPSKPNASVTGAGTASRARGVGREVDNGL